MNKNTLIFFPLITMFLLAMVGAPGIFSTGKYTVGVTRPVSENQLDDMTTYIHEAQDNYGGNNAVWWDIKYYWVQNRIWYKLGEVFNYTIDPKVVDGYSYMADDLRDMIRDYGAPPPYINENDILDIIAQDPDTVEELEELKKAGISLSETLIFVGMFVGLLALAAIIGLRIFGSGLAGASIGLIFKLSSLLLLWTILTTMSYSILFDFPTFGALIWLILTFSYTSGVLMSIAGAGGGGEE